MNINKRTYIDDDFQYSLFSIGNRKNNICFYHDQTFKDIVKMSIKDGIVLSISTYELTKPIKDCLSRNVYTLFQNSFYDNVCFSYERIRDELFRENSIREKEFFDVKLKDFDLRFCYYRSPINGGCVVSHREFVRDVPLNDISDEELLDKKEGIHYNTSFHSGIESAYYQAKKEILYKSDREGLLIHLIDSLSVVAEEIFNEKLIKDEKDGLRGLLSKPIVYGIYDNGLHTVRDEWGNELCRY